MACAQPVDFAGVMPQVAARLLGAPNRRLSSARELRFGSQGSMSIDLDAGRYYDHEAKRGGGVIDLIRDKEGCDTAGALSWLEANGLKEPPPPPPTGRAPTKAILYSYCDERGAVLSQVKRTPDKRFLQLGPDGRGGFHAARGCMADVRRVPYRLPELVAADPHRAVFVVEGEKDADRLTGLGLVATCNAEGAGKFRAELAQHFAGRDVVIIVDNDDPGRAHAADVLQKLTGVAKRVGVLELAGLPAKGDVSDWLDAGNTVDALKGLALRALEAPSPAIVAARPICATPFVWRDPATIPLRPWVYGRQLLRGTVSLVIAPGATGKTALLMGTALALATGRDLLGKRVWERPQRVWIWNLEDPSDDLARLLLAAARHWGVGEQDVADRLFVDSAIDGAGLLMATEDRDGFRIVEPVMDELAAELIARRIDVLIIDPFVSSHAANENDNGAMDAIAKKWAKVATAANCCVVLSHHTRKLAGAEVGAESARGAKALVDAARSALALNRMTEEEATRFNVEGDDRRRFFRAYDDKNNRAPPADASDWFELRSVALGNGPDGDDGDSIQVVVPWIPPDTFDGVTTDHLRQVQSAVAQGQWRKSDQAADWVGHAVAGVLELDMAKKADKARVRRLLSQWIANGALLVETRNDGKSNPRPFVVVGRAVDDVSPPPRGEVRNGGEVGKTFPTTTSHKREVGGGEERPHRGGEKKVKVVFEAEPDPADTFFQG